MKQDTKTAIANKIERTISKLDSLSVLPAVITEFLSQLDQFQLTPTILTEIIESDPAITVKIFSLIHEQGLHLADGQGGGKNDK